MKKNLKLEDFMEGKTDALSIKQKYLKTISKEEKKTKITFITPNVIGSKTQARRVQPPSGIACLAGVLDEYGFKNMQIIDSSAEGYNNIKDLDDDFIEFGLDDKEVIRKIEKFKPDIVGISALFSSQFSCAERLGREIKNKLSQIKDLEVLGPIDSPLLKIKKNFRSRLLIRFNKRFLMQKKIINVLNRLKISSKIKLTVDVDPINFA